MCQPLPDPRQKIEYIRYRPSKLPDLNTLFTAGSARSIGADIKAGKIPTGRSWNAWSVNPTSEKVKNR
jgi:hypothetical protein